MALTRMTSKPTAIWEVPPPCYIAAVSELPTEQMQRMEVWGGSQLTGRSVKFGGLDAWVYSKPHGQAKRGGDVYYERHVERCVPRGLLRFDRRGTGVLPPCHIEPPERVHSEASVVDPGRFGSWPPDVLL